ncbi:MAG: hypothetical protein ACC652_08095 [Acidimicrobiales bacterium]
MTEPKHYLVVGNQTLGGAALVEYLYEIATAEQPALYFVVPCTTPPGRLAWTDANAEKEGADRLEAMLEFARALGIDAAGSLGDIDPALACLDALESFGPFDGIIVTTQHTHLSQWLHLDVLHRIERNTSLPVSHINSAVARTPAEARDQIRTFLASKGISKV